MSRYIDLQINGFAGVDFNNPGVSRPEIAAAAMAMRQQGVEAALPTVITGPLDDMCQCIHNLRAAMDADAEVASVFKGIHIEGPFLCREPGYIGAHPAEHARDQDTAVLQQLCDAGGPWTKLVTLAPEMDPNGRMTSLCVERGIVVAAGHTNASLSQLDTCLNAGLSLFTHLGNGCPQALHRHDNIIYRALRRADRLRFTLIADGFHLPQILFENLLSWIPHERLAVVSDAISAAGQGPGTYCIGGRAVTVGSDKAARDASGEHFVGSACTMRDADNWLEQKLALSPALRHQLLYLNPAQWLGLPAFGCGLND